MSNISIFDALN